MVFGALLLLQCVVMGAAASGVTMGVLRCITKGATPQTLEGVRISAQVHKGCVGNIQRL